MITKIEKIVIENESPDNGFCIVKRQEQNNSNWLELHGNEDKSDYPLIFNSNEDIDDFCLSLKNLLKNSK